MTRNVESGDIDRAAGARRGSSCVVMLRCLTIVAALAVCSAASLSAQRTRDLTPYLMSDRSAEIALARTAAPKSIADSAAVLVLTKTGYVNAARGTNGFICLVQRSFFAAIGDSSFWAPAIRAPICLNPPAVRTVLPEMLKRTEWIMAGASTDEVAKRTRRAYVSHELPRPAAGSMGYMLSPEQHLAEVNPHWVPHLMFWFDNSLPPGAWGLGDVNNTILDGTPRDSVSPIRLLLIPVRRWSDGTPALPTGR